MLLYGLDAIGLHVGNNIIKPVDVVRDLGVLLDSKLKMINTSVRSQACVFLPSTATEAGPAATRSRYYSHTCFCFRTEQAGLL